MAVDKRTYFDLLTIMCMSGDLPAKDVAERMSCLDKAERDDKPYPDVTSPNWRNEGDRAWMTSKGFYREDTVLV